jgi:hypothetical protein
LDVYASSLTDSHKRRCDVGAGEVTEVSMPPAKKLSLKKKLDDLLENIGVWKP